MRHAAVDLSSCEAPFDSEFRLSENPFGAKDADGFRASRPLWGRRRIAEILYGADADLARLQGLTVAVIGYGIQGRAQALNIRDSGVKNVAMDSVRDDS